MSGESVRGRLYERYASQHAGLHQNATATTLFRRDFLPFLPSDRTARILDIGCGQGDLVAEFHRAGYLSAEGVDISPEQVALAHRRGIASVIEGDFVEVLEQRAGRLDVVTATDFFEHLSKAEVLHTLDRVLHALRPGGVLIGRVPNAVSPFGGNYQHGDFTHETSFTARSIRQITLAAGFADIRTVPCLPLVHGWRSAVRRGVWSAFSGIYKLALASETGVLGDHIVTQNLVFVARRHLEAGR